jgi:hypothetical protein
MIGPAATPEFAKSCWATHSVDRKVSPHDSDTRLTLLLS